MNDNEMILQELKKINETLTQILTEQRNANEHIEKELKRIRIRVG